MVVLKSPDPNAAMVLAIATGTWNVLIESVMPTAGPQ